MRPRSATFLRDHPKVEKVGYLGFLEEGSRQADIFHRHCTGAGSTFSLYLKGGEKEAFAFLDALQIANLAVSLGGTETLASAPAAMTHLSVPDERKKAARHHADNLVRISIGVRECRRSDRRLRQCAERGLAPVLDRPAALFASRAELAVRVHRDRLVGPFERRASETWSE